MGVCCQGMLCHATDFVSIATRGPALSARVAFDVVSRWSHTVLFVVAGISLVGTYDTTDEIEDLVRAFRTEIISNRTESVDESEAEGKFDDLYKVRYYRSRARATSFIAHVHVPCEAD